MFIHSSGFWIPAWYFLFYHPSLCRALYNNAHILRYRVVFASVLAREKVGHRQPNLKLNLVQQQAFFSTTVGKDWIRTDTLHILPHTETRANNEQQKTWKQTDTVATSSSMFMVGWRTPSRLPYCFACSFPILPFFILFSCEHFFWAVHFDPSASLCQLCLLLYNIKDTHLPTNTHKPWSFSVHSCLTHLLLVTASIRLPEVVN